MRFNGLVGKSVRRAGSFLFRRGLRFAALASQPLQREKEDDSLLQERADQLHAAAERYYLARRPFFDDDTRKPFLADASSPRLIARLGWMLSELVFNQDLIVMDFGCGTGWLSRILNGLRFNVIGLDVSRTALDFADRAMPHGAHYLPGCFAHFLEYDGRTFPLSDASVHFIISLDAFHHVPNQAAVLKEMHRVLVPGGRLVLSEPGIGHVRESSTADDVARYGVLERDVTILDFEEKALAAGFDEVFLKPCPVETSERWPRRRYRDFFKGRVDLESFTGLRRAMIVNPLFVCQKAGDLASSYHHRAEVRVLSVSLEAAAGDTVKIPFELKNTGLLAFSHRKHPSGGFITVSARILDRAGAPALDEGGRLELQGDVVPGEAVALELSLKVPSRAGAYAVRIEPVYEGFYWFSEKGTKPADVPLLVR